jgi:aminoglycoside phosphotransferase (APT) family kinase protein
MSRQAEDKTERPPLATSTRDLAEVGASLASWWKTHHGEDVEICNVATPGGTGVANETIFFDATTRSDEHRCVLRIEAGQKLFLDASLPEAYRIIETLGAHSDVPVPTLLGLESDPAILGAPFFVMRKVEGDIPTDVPSYNESGFLVDATAQQREQLWHSAIETLATLHRTDPELLSFLRPGYSGKTGLEQDLSYWTAAATWSAAGYELPVLEASTKWLWDNLPADHPTGFAWGDSRYANMVFHDFTCAAVLDWDMASLAGAEADLGWWALFEYTEVVGRGLELLPGMGMPADTIALWEKFSGRAARHMDYFMVFAAYRMCIAVTRAATMLTAGGILPPGSEMLTNNVGTQYLVSMLDLPPVGTQDMTWPGL